MEIHDTDPELSYYDEDVVYQINTFGADFTIDGLIARFDREDIFRPHFQRNYVWNIFQASKFVESILLGLPIPSVFLYREEDTHRHLIVDGLQRLTTLHGFALGKFPNTDKTFSLRRVQRRFEGRTINDLEPAHKRRFYDSVIHAIIIQQLAPDDDRSSVFHIFERLNSNGTPLRAQEMRAAIYHGPFQELLFKLNHDENWRRLFGNVHKRSKDQELILRFLALLIMGEQYRKPMTAFLNNFMGEFRYLPEGSESDFSDAFHHTTLRIIEALGERAFKPRRSFNVALFDALMVAVARNPSASARAIKIGYESLLNDEEFRHFTERATSDEQSVQARLAIAHQAIRAAA